MREGAGRSAETPLLEPRQEMMVAGSWKIIMGKKGGPNCGSSLKVDPTELAGRLEVVGGAARGRRGLRKNRVAIS